MKGLDGLRELNAALGVTGSPIGRANDRGEITPLPMACPPFDLVRRIYSQARSSLAKMKVSPHGDVNQLNGYNRRVSEVFGRLLAEHGIYEEC